jgi:cell fate regulator YaaT (PSP1 superfamily)
MYLHHFVRVGLVGQIGRFAALDSTRYNRGSRVIVRTTRGLEIGEILINEQESATFNATDSTAHIAKSADGVILRGMTIEDQLLEARLEQKKNAAAQACENLLTEKKSTAVLIDVEHLFDGRTIYFYFLGNVPQEVQQLTEELANTYDVAAQFRQFSDTLTEGCGPGCGTESAEGGGCSSCSTGCAIASACGTKKAKH